MKIICNSTCFVNTGKVPWWHPFGKKQVLSSLYYFGQKHKILHEGPALPLRKHFRASYVRTSFNMHIPSGVLCGNQANTHSNKKFFSNIKVFGIIKNYTINEAKIEKKLYDVNHVVTRKGGLNFQKCRCD